MEVEGTSITVSNRSGKSGHSCLVPDFAGKTFSPSLSMMLVVVFDTLYQVEEVSFNSYRVGSFSVTSGCWLS